MNQMLNKLFLEKTNDTKLQFFRYLFVGGVAAFVNIGSLYILTDIFKIYYIFSNIIGFILGLIVNYILSKWLVFSTEKSINKIFEFLTYALIGVIGLGLDTVLIWFLTETILIYYLLSKLISTFIVFIWNFSARKLLYILINKRSS